MLTQITGLQHFYHGGKSKRSGWVHVGMACCVPIIIYQFGEQGMAQWWECSPPTNIAQVQILVSMPYAGWVCWWFSPLLREVFLRVLWFWYSLQKLTFPNSSSTKNQVDEEPLCGCASSKSLLLLLLLLLLLKLTNWIDISDHSWNNSCWRIIFFLFHFKFCPASLAH